MQAGAHGAPRLKHRMQLQPTALAVTVNIAVKTRNLFMIVNSVTGGWVRGGTGHGEAVSQATLHHPERLANASCGNFSTNGCPAPSRMLKKCYIFTSW
jgi:hypothetical protein